MSEKQIIADLRAENFGDAADLISTQADQIERLKRALRDTNCPRPCNPRPDDFTVGQCVDAGECGCGNGAALTEEKQS